MPRQLRLGDPFLLTHGRDVDHIRKFCPMVYGSLVDMTA